MKNDTLETKRPFKIKVECYSGYRAEETPKCFWIGNRKVTVVEIRDRWLAPDHRYFKILGDDNSIYILRHDSNHWTWELVPNQAGK